MLLGLETRPKDTYIIGENTYILETFWGRCMPQQEGLYSPLTLSPPPQRLWRHLTDFVDSFQTPPWLDPPSFQNPGSAPAVISI